MSPEQKPLPSVELSLKFMSWSIKEFVETSKEHNRIFDQKISELISQIRELNKNISSKSSSPF
jgi:hypothetical protein